MWERYYTAASVDGALRLLADYGPEARLIAGGTDLLIELRRGQRRSPVLVDVTRIAGLDRVDRNDDGLVEIGPAVTHNQAVASSLLSGAATPLVQACWQVGTPQLRNRGTIAGNLVTASPANDTIAALWALDARLTLRSVRGERTLSFADFYQGVRKTALASDEMVTRITLPPLRPEQRGCFVKLGLRRSHAIALVNAAVLLTFDGERVSRARITLGSVAPTIIRAAEAEQALIGARLGREPVAREAAIAEAAALAAQAAVPIDDIRGSAGYRRRMVAVLVRRALSALCEECRPEPFPGRRPMLWGRGDGHFRPLAGEGLCHDDGGSQAIEFRVNGRPVAVSGASGRTLLDLLRQGLGLTGSKEGCAEGECGACTVWLDGMAVLACLVPAPRAHGADVVTVEGLSPDGARAPEGASAGTPEGVTTGEGTLHPVQQAFIDEGAVQCGYCTPGFVMSGANLLQEIPRPSREQIAAGLHGNLCRCTGYYKIVRAIERAAEATDVRS